MVPTIIAGLIGYSILGLRGHYFAICTLGLGVAAGEISGGIEIIGAGQGFTTPPFPDVGSLESRGEFFYFLSLENKKIHHAILNFLHQETVEW